MRIRFDIKVSSHRPEIKISRVDFLHVRLVPFFLLLLSNPLACRVTEKIKTIIKFIRKMTWTSRLTPVCFHVLSPENPGGRSGLVLDKLHIELRRFS